MAIEYPFIDLVRQHLKDKNQTLKWLADTIGRSERWFYHIKNFDDLSVGDVVKIARALDWNIVGDYDKWRAENREEPVFFLGESVEHYQVAPRPKRISVNIKISSTEAIAELNMSKMLRAVRVAGEQLGFEIE